MSQNDDEDDDYMSDAILLKCEDKRPGLVFSQTAKHQIAKEKKQKQSNEQSKAKPKKVVEQEKRNEGLTKAISSDNKGFSLLQKMGYKPGMVIGKKGTGRAEPVPIEIKTDRGGLGREAEMKRKQSEMQAMRATMGAKRQRMEVKQKQSFLQHMSEKFASKTTEKDLRTSQTACYQLDTESGYKAPVESFHWPDNWQTLTEQVEEKEEDEATEDEDVDEGQALTDVEKLQCLTEYLRTTYYYCIWCGTKYDDSQDLQSHCPGDTAEAHD